MPSKPQQNTQSYQKCEIYINHETGFDKKCQMKPRSTKDSQRHFGHNENPNRIRRHELYINQLQPTLIKKKTKISKSNPTDFQRHLGHGKHPNRIWGHQK